jgi:MoaA/NifB/PqqE/SkfB family radical SAM enzyme
LPAVIILLKTSVLEVNMSIATAREFYVVPTYKCNSNCPMCGVLEKKRKEGWQYTYHQLTEKIDGFKPTREDTVILSGGEPTIYKETQNIIPYVRNKYGSKVIMFSNGRAFKNPLFVKKFESLDLTNCLIPLFSHKPETHDLLTGAKGSFEETVKGLSNLNKSQIPFSIKTVAMKKNYIDIPNIIKFCLDHFDKATSIGIHGMHLQGDAPGNRDIVFVRHSEAIKYVEEACDLVIERGVNLVLSAFPMCSLDPYYWKYYITPRVDSGGIIAPDEKEIQATNKVNYKKMPEKCDSCQMKQRCSWPWNMYYKIAGDSELRPIQ